MDKEKAVKEDYISLLAVIKKLWKRRRLLIKIVIIFFVIGVFVAMFSPKEYNSGVKFLSQTSNSTGAGSRLSGIAALVGININSGLENGEIPTNIYPKIVNSLPFQRKLMNTELSFKGIDTTVTFTEYYTKIAKPDAVSLVKKYTIGLPGTILKGISGKEENDKVINNRLNDSLIFISKSEENLQKKLKEKVLFSLDETDGVISISVSMPEPIPAAQMAKSAQELLQKAIITYRNSKAKDQLGFIEGQYEVQKENYQKAQTRLANYKDRNLFNTTETSRIELSRLQSDYDLAYSVYSELERQQVAQNIQVKKDTPIFTILNPATVPTDPIAPNRIKIVLIALFLGVFLAIVVGLVIDFVSGFKTKWSTI
ncbi:GNVR domain-containing protein [Marixanthomonas ophiurae]|uniref:Lipopolysaccharide biosynthesis protein n=1 Tax=Marixanthomonas ophiurae TaxID=387659 RepID=A0A3E1Q770_9FLAO|nr:GNVR domain-containing protein [Marixanthomonas ophiurae]RFN57964.1 hypothetical protein DZ858_12025 [Marixanthomonas ophiurae]